VNHFDATVYAKCPSCEDAGPFEFPDFEIECGQELTCENCEAKLTVAEVEAELYVELEQVTAKPEGAAP
jgi:hypothetical protein